MAVSDIAIIMTPLAQNPGPCQPPSNNEDESYSDSPSYTFPNMTPAQFYETLPLSKDVRQIRVLDVERNLDLDAPLRGTLRTVNLQDYPSFTALSYVWGQPVPHPRTIRCNGCCDIPLVQSGYLALTHLRAKHEQLTIWVDAVCIHQDYDDEKASQIPMMEEIYTWAEAVYIWLGPGNAESAELMRTLRKKAERSVTFLGVLWVDGHRPQTMSRDFWMYFWEIGVPFFSSDEASLRALQLLLDNEWLRRAWTFQEIMLASNPVVVCGLECISWNLLQRVLYMALYRLKRRSGDGGSEEATMLRIWHNLHPVWASLGRYISQNVQVRRKQRIRRLSSHGAEQEAADPVIDLSHMSSANQYAADPTFQHYKTYRNLLFGTLSLVCLAFFDFFVYRVFYIFSPGDSSKSIAGIIIGLVSGSVLGVLCVSRLNQKHIVYGDAPRITTAIKEALRTRQSTMVKDRAFAMFGILGRLGVQTRPMSYAKSLGTVYHELFLSLVEWDAHFLNLIMDVTEPHLAGAPSWVPDWSNLAHRQWVSDDKFDHYSNPGAATVAVRLLSGGAELAVTARIVGPLTFCSGPFSAAPTASNNGASQAIMEPENLEAPLTAALSALTAWMDAAALDAPARRAYEPISKALYSCLEVTPFERLGENQRRYEEFRLWFRFVWQLRQQQQQDAGDPEASNMPPLLLAAMEQQQSRHLLEFTHKICRLLTGRRGLFSSHDGYVGSGPPEAQVGDVIVVIKGVSMPMILRAQQREEIEPIKYTVVGAAYVHGLDIHRNAARAYDEIILA